MKLSQRTSEAVLTAALIEAEAIGVPMNIALVDNSAILKAFVRMDGALLGSIDVAMKKARTAALFGMNTEAVGEFCKPGGTSPGLDTSNGGLIVFAGGVPLRDRKGQPIGAVGISGGSVEQDSRVAAAAASVCPQSLPNEGGGQWSIAIQNGQEIPASASPESS